MRITVGANEHKLIPILWLGEETELSYDIVLAGPKARVDVWGLLVGKGTQEVAVNIKVTHAAPQTVSYVNVKSALYDSSKTHVNGLAKINAGAKGSDAWLAAHIMLLSDKATGEAIPNLEIIENDIKAGHATTIGRIDELQLFYLMTRGFDRFTAKSMIVHGFLQDAIEHLPDEMRVQAVHALEQ